VVDYPDLSPTWFIGPSLCALADGAAAKCIAFSVLG